MSDPIATCRAELAAGNVLAARAALEKARREHHMHGGPNPWELEVRVCGAEHGQAGRWSEADNRGGGRHG